MKRSNPENITSCLLCAKYVHSDEQHLTKRNIFQYPDWLNFVVEIVGFELCYDESLPDIVCNGCIDKLNEYFAYRREIFNNVMKHHINYYNLKNDLTKVEFYQAKIRQNRFESDYKIDHNVTTKRMNDHLIITDVRSERIPDLDQSYLLEPMFQTSENVLATESGGMIHTMNEEITARRCAENAQEYKCEFCDKIYNKQHYYRKHMRKHNQNKAKKNKEKRRYLCHEMNCGKLFDRLIELRNHMTIHGSKFKCPCCDAQFPLWYDYEWHYQVCDATQRGRCEDGNNRRTRSKSRLSKSIISELSDCSLSQTEGNGEESNCAKKTVYSFYDDCSKFKNDHTIIQPTSGAESEASVISTLSDYRDKERLTQLQAHKIRRKHRKEKRRAERQGKTYFACTFHKMCEFGSTSLTVTMDHENVKHRMLRLYNCSICKVCFSSKESLIRHRKLHDSEKICNYCDINFANQYDLQHHISLNHEKSYNCNICSRSYLKQAELSQHLEQMHSNDNKKVTPGILCRLDSEGKSESKHKQSETVSYTSKELIQRSRRKSMVVEHKNKIEIVDIDPNARRVKKCWKYQCELINAKPQPFTLSPCENIENLQVPIDFYFKRPSSPIVFCKEEDDICVMGMGNIISRSISPITTLDKFNMFLTESHGNTISCCDSLNEPEAKRLRPDSAISYIPSFEELFPQNHIYYDQTFGTSSKWS